VESELVAGKRTVIVREGEEFELPEGHSATWIGRGRSIVLLSDGVVGGAYRVADVDQDADRVKVLLSGDALEGSGDTGQRELCLRLSVPGWRRMRSPHVRSCVGSPRR
jgi:hypothetical protein